MTNFSYLKKASLILFITLSPIFAQQNVRIMTYNLLKYSSASDDRARNADFKVVVDDAKPDILVCQEVESQAGMNQFLEDVMGSGFKAGTFLNGPDTDNAIFYRDSLFTFLSHRHLSSSPRHISEFRLEHKVSGDTLILFGVHFKASTGSDNENLRNSAASVVLNTTKTFHANQYYMIMGDFNVYGSNEPAYQKLTNASGEGYFVDELTTSWSHANSADRFYYTQSPRTTQFGGGANGGLDDRFDLILISPALSNSGGVSYLENSYKNFGNDGNHYNTAVNSGFNTAVSAAVANALHDASDHLPVFIDVEFENVTSVDEKENLPRIISLSQNYPNPFNPATTIHYSISAQNDVSNSQSSLVTLKIYDLLGSEIVTLVNEEKGAGEYSVQFNASTISSGVYYYRLTAGEVTKTRKMAFLK